MTAPTPQLERQRRAARAVQALTGILITATAIATYDLRAGAATLGILILLTSAPWRPAK